MPASPPALDLRGKIVLLDFWATWCPPCVKSVPDVKHFAKKFANEPVVIVSITGDQDEDVWRKFVEKNKMDWTRRSSKVHGDVRDSSNQLMNIDIRRSLRQASGHLAVVQRQEPEK